MFPFDLDDEDDVVEYDTEEEDTKAQPTDYEIDFTTGKLTGNIITGLPAIIQWIRLALGTERYFYYQYSWDYGAELESLIGKNYTSEYVESEVRRMIADALTINENIKSISDIKVNMDRDKLFIDFKVDTVFGSEEVNINV